VTSNGECYSMKCVHVRVCVGVSKQLVTASFFVYRPPARPQLNFSHINYQVLSHHVKLQQTTGLLHIDRTSNSDGSNGRFVGCILHADN